MMSACPSQLGWASIAAEQFLLTDEDAEATAEPDGEQMRRPEVEAETEATAETDGEQVRHPVVESETEQEHRQMPSEDFRSSGRVPTCQRIRCQIQLILTVSALLPKKVTHRKAP